MADPALNDDRALVKSTPAKERVRTSRYRVLGAGSSVGLSVVSILGLLALWVIATHGGWIKPLFHPEARGDLDRLLAGGEWRPRQSHPVGPLPWSMYRVFSAFLLTVVIKIPVGIAMGVSRFARGLFDPPIEFYRPLPPLATSR